MGVSGKYSVLVVVVWTKSGMAVRLFSSNFSVFPVPVCLSRLADQLQVELDSILFVRESKWVAGETTKKRIPRCPRLWLDGVCGCGLRFAVCASACNKSRYDRQIGRRGGEIGSAGALMIVWLSKVACSRSLI
jgi:hypothetical protein